MKQEKPVHRKTRTKRILKLTLLELRKSKNIRNISVKELCEKAELNRSTFYLHYSCPEDVLLEREDDTLGKLEASLANTNYPKGSINFWIVFLDNIKEYRDFFYLLFTQKEEHKFLLRLKGKYLQIVRTQFLSDKKRNDYRKEYRISGNVAVLVRWLADKCITPTKEIASLRYARYDNLSKLKDIDIQPKRWLIS